MDSLLLRGQGQSKAVFSWIIRSAMEYSSCILQSFSTFTQKSCTNRGWSCSGKQVAGCLWGVGGGGGVLLPVCQTSNTNVLQHFRNMWRCLVPTVLQQTLWWRGSRLWQEPSTGALHNVFAPSCPHCIKCLKHIGLARHFIHSLAGQENQSRTSLAEDNTQTVRLTEPFVVVFTLHPSLQSKPCNLLMSSSVKCQKYQFKGQQNSQKSKLNKSHTFCMQAHVCFVAVLIILIPKWGAKSGQQYCLLSVQTGFIFLYTVRAGLAASSTVSAPLYAADFVSSDTVLRVK